MSIKPIIILQTGAMSKSDMKRMRDSGFCVVESKNPSAVRFMDVPFTKDYSVQERAAIELARTLLHDGKIGTCSHRQAIGAMYANILLAGDPLKTVAPVEKLKP